MQTDTRTEKIAYNGQEQIDLTELLDDSLRCLKRYWIQFLLIIIVVTAMAVTYFNFTYQPIYSARVTYAVNRTGDTSVDASIARRLSSSVEILSETAEFRREVFSAAGVDTEDDDFYFTSQYTEGANLFTAAVNSESYEHVDAVLESFMKIYPAWADRITGFVELETVDRIQASEEPDNPYSLTDSVSKGVLAGMALVVCLGVLYVQTLHTVRKEKDMKAVTSAGCIALIPETRLKKRSKNRKHQLLISNKRVDWGFKQSVLTVQSRIDLQMEKNNQKVLVVTSTMPQEGKTLISVNLAIAAVQNGKKSLIIDGDMRNPSVGAVLGLEKNLPGLSDYFTGNADADDIIVSSGEISVITAGSLNSGVSGILSDELMCELMVYLRKTYDLIIIDTPPSGLFFFFFILAGYGDTVLYVVRHDMAEIREIREGISPFSENGRLCGYVINRSKGSLSSYGRYGKYGYSRYGRYGKYKRYIKADESSMNTEDSLSTEESE